MNARSQTIDCLRAVAVVAVIVQHCLEQSPLNNPSALITEPASFVFSNGFNLGRFGVIIFFLISGYLIPSSFGRGPRPIASFVLGRFFRLYPMYWLSIVLQLMLIAAFGWSPVGLGQLLGNITMFQMGFGVENILALYWTLFIELLFYIGCVILFLLGILHVPRSMWLMTVLIASFLILLSTWIITIPEAQFLKYIEYLITVGTYLFIMFIGHTIRQMREVAPTVFPWRAVTLFVAVLGFSMFARSAGAYNQLLSPTAVFFSSVSALLFFLVALRFRFVDWAFVEFTGRISYGMYLLHALVLSSLLVLLKQPSGWLPCVQLLILGLGLSWISALAGFYLIEDAGIRLGSRIRRSLERSAQLR